MNRGCRTALPVHGGRNVSHYRSAAPELVASIRDSSDPRELISGPDAPQPAVMPIAAAVSKPSRMSASWLPPDAVRLSSGSAHVVTGRCQNADVLVLERDVLMTVRGCVVWRGRRPVDPGEPSRTISARFLAIAAARRCAATSARSYTIPTRSTADATTRGVISLPRRSNCWRFWCASAASV